MIALPSILVADPPWKLGDSLPGKGRGAAKKYPCMSVSQIARFPLPTLADDALLFLWRLASMPEEALFVAKAWGFNPKSEIVWVKLRKDGNPLLPKMGMGRYGRQCHEVCMVCSRGRGIDLIANRGMRSVIYAKLGMHSEKPREFNIHVDRLTGDAPKVELFARRQWPGWTCLGNEMPVAPGLCSSERGEL